jgi:hypothetical protein
MNLAMPPPPDPGYWRVFNIMLRLLGIGGTFAGLAATISFGLGWPPLEGEAPSINLPSLISGGLVTLLGLGFLIIPPFRPDLGDTRVGANLFRVRAPPRQRAWWTGDPVSRH